MSFSKIKLKSSATPYMSYEKCIAKSIQNDEPGITVEQHCVNAASVADKFRFYFPNIDFLVKWGSILTAVHDAGKISPGFQKKYFNNYLLRQCRSLAQMQPGCFCGNHAEISEAAVRDFLNEFLDESASGEIVGVHHGRRANPKSNDSGVYGGTKWANERLAFIRNMVNEYGDLPRAKLLTPIEKSILAGFVTISDWIASDESFFPSDSFLHQKCVSQAEKALENCGFRKISIKPNLSFEDIFNFPPRASQVSLINSVKSPGVYIMEAETGSGKTEAALYAAYKMLSQGLNRGIYFALPTKLTSDRIHKRVCDFVNVVCEKQQLVMLSHGSAWLNDDLMNMMDSGDIQRWINKAG